MSTVYLCWSDTSNGGQPYQYAGAWEHTDDYPTATVQTSGPPLYDVINERWDPINNAWHFPKTYLWGVLATARYEHQTSGVDVVTSLGTYNISTADTSLIRIGISCRAAYNQDPTDPRLLKTAGGFVELTNADFVEIDKAIAAHIQRAIDAEAVVYADIDSLTITMPDVISAAYFDAYDLVNVVRDDLPDLRSMMENVDPALGDIRTIYTETPVDIGRWMLADNRVLLQAEYPDLFAVIGDRFNEVGDNPATEFRLMFDNVNSGDNYHDFVYVGDPV